MGLFGPSQREMTDAVVDGIHQAIRTTYSVDYKVKQGKIPVKGKYMYMPPVVDISPYPFGNTELEPIKPVPVEGNDIIYDVVYFRKQKRFNPFTDVTTENIVDERNVARYYSYDGWTLPKISKLIRFAFREGYYPDDENLAQLIIEGQFDGRL